MRNPALRLVGIAASPGGGGVFGTRAEEELRQWLETRLDALGIDPVAYSRFVLSLLRRPDSALSPLEESVTGSNAAGRNVGRRNNTRTRPKARLPSQGDREQRRAVVQCLTSAADQKIGIEALVDELCAKLKDLEGGGSNEKTEENEKTATNDEIKNTLENLTPRDRALRYYAAFPALQPATPKKFSHRKDRNTGKNNIGNSNNCIHNNNNNNNNSSNNNKNIINNTSNGNNKKKNYGVFNNNNTTTNNNNNNKTRPRKTKMSIAIESRQIEEKESFGFAKSMEREREKERELELDRLKLAQLQAKFDESLEALWNSGPGNSQDTASIWAAPSLSIPSGPLWPVDTNDAPFSLPTCDNNGHADEMTYQDSIVDDSPLIPWDIDLISIEDYAEDPGTKEKSEQLVNWSDAIMKAPWCWKSLSSNFSVVGQSPRTGSCFFPVVPNQSPPLPPAPTLAPAPAPAPAVATAAAATASSSSSSVAVVTSAPTAPTANAATSTGSKKEPRSNVKLNLSEQAADEDLLTSARTHFRPIKDDGHWADGTTFPVNNTVERVAYRRSESGNLLYLPGGESPYMEYRENDSSTSTSNNSPDKASTVNLTLKFRVRQCDKCIQTEPIRSPVKRRILSEQQDDRVYYTPVGSEDVIIRPPDLNSGKEFQWDKLEWIQPRLSLHNDRKRRHSSSFRCRPLAALRPLTL